VPGVTVAEQFPEGVMLSEGGKGEHEVEIGSVDAEGKVNSDRYAIDLEKIEGSQITARAVATAERVGEVSDSSTLTILNPEMSFTVNAPKQQYLGRDIDLQVSLKNEGDAPLKEVRVKLPVPDDAERLSISRGDIERGDDGRFEVGTIAAGESRNFTVSFLANEPGDYQAEAVADAYCVAAIRRSLAMTIKGIPALQLEVVDSQDPVKVGEQTTYDIRLINEGSAEDLKVRVSGELPEGFSFVSAEGDLQGQADGTKINFPVIDRLDPGDEITMQVTVQADSASRGKLKLDVKSQQLRQSLREEESTTSY
jgi:uncharacterized repeat protein (TIGR01451 family)